MIMNDWLDWLLENGKNQNFVWIKLIMISSVTIKNQEDSKSTLKSVLKKMKSAI